MSAALLAVCALLTMGATGCEMGATSTSGIKQQTVALAPGNDGFTVEQRNIRDRLVEDNKPGAIKHLYVISAFSGQVLIYSTVKGKVTSGGKRLAPTMLDTSASTPTVDAGGGQYWRSAEMIGDDGTYGSSSDYLYWWDAQGRYHQQYAQGAIIHISDQPLPIKSVTLNLETAERQP